MDSGDAGLANEVEAGVLVLGVHGGGGQEQGADDEA
jgi:hypothetical protein